MVRIAPRSDLRGIPRKHGTDNGIQRFKPKRCLQRKNCPCADRRWRVVVGTSARSALRRSRYVCSSTSFPRVRAESRRVHRRLVAGGIHACLLCIVAMLIEADGNHQQTSQEAGSQGQQKGRRSSRRRPRGRKQQGQLRLYPVDQYERWKSRRCARSRGRWTYRAGIQEGGPGSGEDGRGGGLSKANPVLLPCIALSSHDMAKRPAS